jgi:hypothetical protein
MPNLCATFRKEAGVVWNRMRTAAALGLSLSEETLTECALYNIAIAHQGTEPGEAKHGADWEWWLVRGNKGLGLRVQAKRLFPDGRYNSLTKPGATPYQRLDKNADQMSGGVEGGGIVKSRISGKEAVYVARESDKRRPIRLL